jgi:hypothetical protein
MTIGPIIGGIGYLLFLTMGERVDYWWNVLPGVLVFALGLSMTVAPLTAAILGSIPSTQAGIGSATNNAVSRVAGLVATAMIGVILAGELAVDNFHRVIMVTAGLLIVGGIVSFVGIRNPKGRMSDAVEAPTGSAGAAGTGGSTAD